MSGSALPTDGRFVASDRTSRPWITLIVLRGVHTSGTGSNRMANAPNWVAIDTDPRFQKLHREKTRFLWTLMIISWETGWACASRSILVTAGSSPATKDIPSVRFLGASLSASGQTL